MNDNYCKKIEKSSKNKETRWDRIRKRHMSSVNVTTENVKKFFGMNFINEHQLRILNGESKRRFYLNPALVMNVRHEMVCSCCLNFQFVCDDYDGKCCRSFCRSDEILKI